MNLNKETLKEFIVEAAREKNIYTYIVEKDYYVTKLLKEIVTRDPNFIFKGGTSLSKCYKIINRFSEDIDLNYDHNSKLPSETKRIFINEIVEISASKCGLMLSNHNDIVTSNDYIKYEFSYSKIFDGLGYIKPNVEVETAFFLDSNPTEIKKANSIIGEYLLEKNQIDIIEKYDLKEFDVRVQSYIRTYIDKIIAICDYYYKNRNQFTSRHIYDLHKLLPLIEFNDDFYDLFESVKQKRIEKKLGYQHAINKSISEQLGFIINDEFYKNDYETNTIKICNDKVSYEEVINSLRQSQEKLLGR